VGRLGRADPLIVAAPTPLAKALKGACPRCGQAPLFHGWVKFAPRCRRCGLDFDSFNVGDGPAAFLILIVGAILTVAAVVVDQIASPAWWVHLVWIPVGLALTVGGLRLGKAWLIAQEYVHRAREGRIAP
jgi:uncharacterized protein (DUF983 family)